MVLPVSSSMWARSMPTRDAVDLERAVDADRLVVLADLIVLRHVRIEVVLPVEDRAVRHRAVQRLAEPQRELDRPLVEHRQRARAARGTPGTRSCSGSAPNSFGHAAEQLRRRRQLDVHLEPDHRLARRARSWPSCQTPAVPERPGSERVHRHSAAEVRNGVTLAYVHEGVGGVADRCSSTATRRRSASGGATSGRSPTPASR